MPTNKHAQIRYRALDSCFRNPGRRYNIDDLVEACNEALARFTGQNEGVKKRQVQEDIKAMEEIWGIELQRVHDGRRVYFSYADPGYSIYGQSLNELEIAQLKSTVAMLHQCKGIPQLVWMEEILARLEHSFNLRSIPESIVDFEHSPYLRGLNFFPEIFNAIVNRQPLWIVYRRYGQAPSERIYHPYYLKQYNNRWFLFGLSSHTDAQDSAPANSIITLALDRMESLRAAQCPYIECPLSPFEDYFRNVVGVTVLDRPPERILLAVDPRVFPYLETKPLHHSQRVVSQDDTAVTIELTLIVNHELENLLMGYIDSLRIVCPLSLRERMAKRLQEALKKNE